jgi:NADH dehydrogenase
VAHIAIVGGGFGGVYAILELRRLGERDITLFDPRERFEFTPLLHEVAGGVLTRDDVSMMYNQLLPGISHIKQSVTHIDLDKKTLTAGGIVHPYDAIIIAPGARTNFFGRAFKGCHVLELKTYHDAIAIRRTFVKNCATAGQKHERGETDGIDELLHAVIIGGGATGVELAGELADLARTLEKEDGVRARVTLIHPRERLLHQLDPYYGEIAAKTLAAKGVVISLNTRVTDIAGNVVTTTTGSMHTACIVWTAGVTPNAIAPLPSPIPVNATLQLAEHPEAFAIGDAAHVDGLPFIQRAQLATKQAQVAAQNLTSVLRGEAPQRFSWKDNGIIVSLGQQRAVGIVAGRRLSGFPAWFLMRTVYLLKFKNVRQECRTAWTYTKRLFTR